MKEETENSEQPTEDNEPKNESNSNMEKILLKLGLAPTATEDDAVAAISALQTERTNLALARVTDAVETAIKERRITADKKEKYLNLGKEHGLDTLSGILADMQPAQKPLDLVRPGATAGGAAPAADVNLTWATATAEQLKQLRDENREEYVRLYKAHFGFAPTF